MIRSKKGRAVAAAVPHDRALLESDGPYVRVGGRVAEPTDVLCVAEYLTQQWERPRDEVLMMLGANLGRLCGGMPELAR